MTNGLVDCHRPDNSAPAPCHNMIGNGEQMKELFAKASLAAVGDVKILITGESGVGKDVLARHIHARSNRAQHPMVSINCAGLTESLLESELFGHTKGSFTGAFRDKPGRLQLAHHGTLFLDEVGDMSLRMQALLLRFLENGELQQVGATAPNVKVDVRVITATNRNLSELITAGQFREDLLYRLRVVHIHVPPLRERPEDIRTFVVHALSSCSRAVVFSEEALQLMERYRWPGNIRELQNAVEQATWLSRKSTIQAEDLPLSVQAASDHIVAVHERRRQASDDLFDALVHDGYSFWEHVYPLFLERNLTRHDLRLLVRRGLNVTHGSYRQLLKIFGIPERDYKRFLNFLATHHCSVDVRSIRNKVRSRPPSKRELNHNTSERTTGTGPH